MSTAGKVNEYTCEKCGYTTRTINAVDGVTPFMIRCRAAVPDTCEGMAQSEFYRCSQSERPRFEWYRPDDSEFAALSEAMRAHVEKGALLIRPVRNETLEHFGFRL